MKSLLRRLSQAALTAVAGAALLFGQGITPAQAAGVSCPDSTKYIQGSIITCSDPLQTGMSFNYQHFKTDPQAATQVGKTLVHTVTVGTKGSASSHVALWDAAAWAVTPSSAGLITGGTLVADIDTTVTVGTLTLDAEFANGLVVTCLTGQTVTNCAGTNTAAGEPDITVSYR